MFMPVEDPSVGFLGDTFKRVLVPFLFAVPHAVLASRHSLTHLAAQLKIELKR